MKKTIFLLPAILVGLAGCNKTPTHSKLDECIYSFNLVSDTSDYTLDLNVLAPTGAPAIGLYQFATSEKLTTTTNPQTGLMPMFRSNEYDVIVAPTHGGLNQVLNQGANFKLAATITYGNFYIVSMGTDTDNILNQGDKIIIFQENDIPGKVFNYLYGDLNLSVTAVAAASDTKLILSQNGVYDGVQYDYVYTAEPVMSASNKTAFINVQDAFKEKSGNKLMTQASVFVRNDVESIKVDKFLSVLKKGIEDGLNNPDLIKTEIEKLGSAAEQQNKFGVPGAMAKKVSLNNGFGLGFKAASEIKEDIRTFVNIVNPNMEL